MPLTGHVRFGGGSRGKGPALSRHLAAWPTLRWIACTTISRRCNCTPAGKTPETGAASCVGLISWSMQPSGCGAMPNEGI
jgi:hypothetical protein